MKSPEESRSLSPFNLVVYSIKFFGAYFLIVFGAGFIAALGRAIQLGAVGEISGGVNTLLEIIIEGARVLTFLLVIGEGNISKGVQRIRNIFLLNSSQWKSVWSIVITRIKVNWVALVINLVIYSAIAFLINFMIDKVVYDTNLLATLQSSHILVPATTEWVLLLFFKNLTVIPFTIIFNGFLLLWATTIHYKPVTGQPGIVNRKL